MGPPRTKVKIFMSLAETLNALNKQNNKTNQRSSAMIAIYLDSCESWASKGKDTENS